jgi:hypothetical protein
MPFVPLPSIEPVADNAEFEPLEPHGLAMIDGENVGLTPALLSSVAPRGRPPPDAEPGIAPPSDDVDEVPDAVPADVPGPQDPPKPVAPELKSKFAVPGATTLGSTPPPPSKVEPVVVVAELGNPALKQGLLLAVGSRGAGLSPPGESSVAPIGMPTAPTDDVAPGMPSGDVIPIAGAPGVGGASCAAAVPQPSSIAASVVKTKRNGTSRLVLIQT